MPDVRVNGVRLNYIERGSGVETVVFSHSYLVDHRHFEPQIAALAGRFRVLAYDHRDHGGSERMTEPYGMEDIYEDGVGFLESVCGGSAHWVGLSTGGFVGVLPWMVENLVRFGALQFATAPGATWPTAEASSASEAATVRAVTCATLDRIDVCRAALRRTIAAATTRATKPEASVSSARAT